MGKRIKRISNWYWKQEKRLSSFGLVGGFLFDIFTLTRVDHTLENVWIGLHLIVAAVGIIFINLYEAGKLKSKVEGRAHFWWAFVIQFAFGGLFSVYLVFYARSASLFASWPFLLLLLINFIANERLRDRYVRTSFQMSMFFLALLFYNIYIVPIIVGTISEKVFIISGIVSLVLMGIFISILAYLVPKKVWKEKFVLGGSIIGVYLLINLLYFSDLIPPIPLSLKQAGVYHSITKDINNDYILAEETSESNWFYRYFVSRQTVHTTLGEQISVFSAVFAPSSFSTNIIHDWQYYDKDKKKWITTNKIPLLIFGGRDSGFRTFSSKNNLFPGLWRVNVETPGGQVIGSLKFIIENVEDKPALTSIIR